MISLSKLNLRNVPFILSYDGRTDNKTNGDEPPKELNLHKIEIDAGRSSIATLHSRNERTFEAVYISDNLATISLINKRIESFSVKQPTLFESEFFFELLKKESEKGEIALPDYVKSLLVKHLDRKK